MTNNRGPYPGSICIPQPTCWAPRRAVTYKFCLQQGCQMLSWWGLESSRAISHTFYPNTSPDPWQCPVHAAGWAGADGLCWSGCSVCPPHSLWVLWSQRILPAHVPGSAQCVRAGVSLQWSVCTAQCWSWGAAAFLMWAMGPGIELPR